MRGAPLRLRCPRLPLLIGAALLGHVASATAAAQARPFQLALSGGPVTFASPTAAAFAAGYAVHPTPLTFQVDVVTIPTPWWGQFQALVSIRSSSATLGGSGKPVGDLEWSLGSAAGPWTPMTTINAPVDSRPMRLFFQNDPWSNTIHFRMRLSWANDVPASYTTGLVVTLTMTGP